MELIHLTDIRKNYGEGDAELCVLKGVSLTIQRGELVALMGASGSGKTTLMNLLGCLDRPTSGSYLLDGEEVTILSSDQQALLRSRKIGFVFQNFNLLPRTTALDNVLMPMEYAHSALSEREGRKRALHLLDQVGLSSRIYHEPARMSGGQQQRVAIARSLINNPVLLLADEPTGNLDSRTSQDILALFQQLNRSGLTIILVTHDQTVANHAQRIILMQDGLIRNDVRDVHTPTAIQPLTALPQNAP